MRVHGAPSDPLLAVIATRPVAPGTRVTGSRPPRQLNYLFDSVVGKVLPKIC